MEPRYCQSCDGLINYVPKRGQKEYGKQKYCSPECAIQGLRKTKPLKNCEVCGKIIPKEPNRNWNMYAKKRFCSRHCSGIGRRTAITLICTNCGKEYKKNPSLAKRVKYNNYCSVKCKSEHKSQMVICDYCGDEFRRISSWIKPDKANYCSRACASKGLRVVKPILTCAFCGRKFERYPSEIKKMSERGYVHVFCSHKCRAAMISAHFVSSRPYIGPIRPVPKERNTKEYKEWRKAVLERDGYRCRDCGVSKVLVCAHHKKSFLLYPKLRYEVSNGVTLCIPCHHRRHSLQTTSS